MAWETERASLLCKWWNHGCWKPQRSRLLSFEFLLPCLKGQLLPLSGEKVKRSWAVGQRLALTLSTTLSSAWRWDSRNSFQSSLPPLFLLQIPFLESDAFSYTSEQGLRQGRGWFDLDLFIDFCKRWPRLVMFCIIFYFLKRRKAICEGWQLG